MHAPVVDYTPKGDIWPRYAPEGTTTYDYDALGALRTVKLPDGRSIEYVVDGLGRRLYKVVNGQITRRFLYGAGMAPIARRWTPPGTVTARFVYGTKPTSRTSSKPTPTTSRTESSDQLGSARLVWDVAAAAILKTMERDESAPSSATRAPP